jgi:choline dehydrogenase-like flavoprotein
MLHEIRTPARCLTASERRLLDHVTKAALPAGQRFPGADGTVVGKVESFLARCPAPLTRSYRALLYAINATALYRHRRPFGSLSIARQQDTLDSWRRGSVGRRLSLRLLLTPLKVAHFDNPDFYRAIGCVYEFEQAQRVEQPRYMTERVHPAAELTGDLAAECDVVVIGSGAGGAVIARELADKGLAVVLVEEGAYFDRRNFTGRPVDMQRSMYRNMGATFSLGNVGIPIPMGRTVGGSTTINSGTCYRVPGRVLAKWQADFGLTEFTEASLAPYYQRVEQVLGVATARAEYLGGVARVVARGCDRLGYKHGPLRRNAPDCDGKGVCCFGCPTDAKRSTNVSYVPLALRAGAELYCGVKVDRILVEDGRAVGVTAHAADGHDRRARLEVRARAVVVACGSLMTPVLLGENGLANGSGQLGRNLSIHPALVSFGVFDEDISGFNAIPQGYAIEEFHDEGILYEGGSTPLDLGMATVPFLGPRLVELAERFDKIAMFGFLIEDTSRGRVRNVRGQPLITYVMNDADVARLKRGAEIIARVYLAAGAKAVLPLIHGFDELRNEADLARLRRARLKARDFEPSAYHPLGTARMGKDPKSSVVGPDHQVHDVPGLYIADGSVMPSSLAVNPQVTIMAMATRAADGIAAAL